MNHATCSTKGLATQLYLIQRLHDLLVDKEVPTTPRKVIAVPTTYEGLLPQLKDYLIIRGSRRGVRFEPFENAGFPPFWKDEVLHLSTPKGVLRIC